MHPRRTSVLLTVLVLLVAACGQSSESTPKDQTNLDGSYSPQRSLSAAVTAILEAEKKNDVSASFALLTPESRAQYKDVADWTKHLNELPAVTGFEVADSSGPDTQVATVEHKPSLDPFKGLSPAKETQTWTGKRYEAGWLVQPDPQTEPVLPTDDKARAAVQAWVEAVQACDKDRARSLQAVETLVATTAPTICNVSGAVTVSAPTPLVEGPESSTIVEQYSTDALVWARTVAVASPAAFKVVVAPFGDDWKVFALI